MLLRLTLGAALVAAVATFAAGHARADDTTLRIAVDGAFPPFNFTKPSGEVDGFDIELTDAIVAKAGLKDEWTRQDWDGLIPGLLAGKFDAISASVSITDERKKRVDFTNPIYHTAIRFVGPKNTLTSEKPDALAGKRLGAQRATIAAMYLQKNYPNSEIKLYDTQDAMRLDLTAGRIDALLADEVAFSHDFLVKPEGAGYAVFGAPIKIGDGIGIVIPKGKDELRKKLNDAIAAVNADGTFEKLSAKFFPGFDLH